MTALVAEAGDQLKVTAEGFRVPGQAANRGAPDLAVLDLASGSRVLIAKTTPVAQCMSCQLLSAALAGCLRLGVVVPAWR
jgi:hypothetical protein